MLLQGETRVKNRAHEAHDDEFYFCVGKGGWELIEEMGSYGVFYYHRGGRVGRLTGGYDGLVPNRGAVCVRRERCPAEIDALDAAVDIVRGESAQVRGGDAELCLATAGTGDDFALEFERKGGFGPGVWPERVEMFIAEHGCRLRRVREVLCGFGGVSAETGHGELSHLADTEPWLQFVDSPLHHAEHWASVLLGGNGGGNRRDLDTNLNGHGAHGCTTEDARIGGGTSNPEDRAKT